MYADTKGIGFGAKIDPLLKLGMIASLLLASSSVGSCYAVYLAGRHAQLNNQQMLEEARANAHKRVAQARLLSEQRASEQRQSAKQAAAQTSYQTCLDSAGAAHDASWAAECKRIGEKALEDHAACLAKLNLPKTYCDAAYSSRDASANCALPPQVATVLDAALEQARHRCLRESKAVQ